MPTYEWIYCTSKGIKNQKVTPFLFFAYEFLHELEGYLYFFNLSVNDKFFYVTFLATFKAIFMEL